MDYYYITVVFRRPSGTPNNDKSVSHAYFASSIYLFIA